MIYLAWSLLGLSALGVLYCNRRYPELAGVAGLLGAAGAGLLWGWLAAAAGVAVSVGLVFLMGWWRFHR